MKAPTQPDQNTMKQTLETLLELAKTPEGLRKIDFLVHSCLGWKATRLVWSGVNLDKVWTPDETPDADFAQIPLWEVDAKEWKGEPPPPYATSLDAIGAVETALTHEQKHCCQKWLQRVLLQSEGPYWLTFATALQRSIAVILTLQEHLGSPLDHRSGG